MYAYHFLLLRSIQTIFGRIPVTESNLSYIFVPSSVLRELFKKLGLPYDSNQKAFNVSSVLVGNDTLPDGADASSIVAGRKYYVSCQ